MGTKIGDKVEVKYAGEWVQGKVVDTEGGVWVQPSGWPAACTFGEIRDVKKVVFDDLEELGSRSKSREKEEDVYSLPEGRDIALYDDGTTVEVLYDKWFPGEILEYMGNDLYIVSFPSGEIAPDVHLSSMRRPVSPWTLHHDKDTGEAYYYNCKTFESSWAKPPGF